MVSDLMTNGVQCELSLCSFLMTFYDVKMFSLISFSFRFEHVYFWTGENLSGQAQTIQDKTSAKSVFTFLFLL
jgi:hypothetical protein